MSCFQILPLENSFVAQWGPVTNTVTGVVDVGATVSVTLLDSEGAEVAGQVWPVSMPHASAGVYRATLPATVELVDEGSYVAVIEALGSGGETGKINVDCTAKIRKR